MVRRIVIALVLLAAAAVFAVAGTGGKREPGQPPTHTPMEQDDFAVAAPNGGIVVCANGKELRLPKELVMRPPPPYDPSSGEPPPPNPTEEMVWRCGTGDDPDRHPRLVPTSRPRCARRGKP